MKRGKKILAAVAVTTALVLGASVLTSCSTGDNNVYENADESN